MKVEISEEMESRKEYGRVRLPRAMLNTLNYKVGDFLQVRNKFGGLLHLIIDLADDNCEMAQITKKDFLQAFVKDKCFTISPVENIMLGCDPELFLLDPSNHVVPAYRYFSRSGEVGNDGILLEFRPEPDISADLVVNNLNGLLKRARTKLNCYPEGRALKIIAISAIGKLTAGFHLHYGLPDRLLGFNDETKMVANLTTHVMDYYVGVPAIIPEGDQDCTRRKLNYIPYGKPGQFRLDKRTFEYRMPGASNLRHPILTRGLLSLGAVVIEDFISRIKEFTENFLKLETLNCNGILSKFYKNMVTYDNLCEIICKSNIAVAKQHVSNVIRPDVRKMIGYEKRKVAIEEYFSFMDKNISNNMEQNWNF